MYALIALQLITSPPLGNTYVPAPIVPLSHYHVVPGGQVYYGHTTDTAGVFVPTPTPRRVETIIVRPVVLPWKE